MYNLKNSGIYCIYSVCKGTRYIGQSVNFGVRWNRHKNALSRGIHPNHHLQAHYNKYESTDLVYSVIEVVDRGELSLEDFKQILNTKEQEYINKSENLFNMALVVGSKLGVNHTEEAKLKMSETRRRLDSGKGIKQVNGKYKVTIYVGVNNKRNITLGLFDTYEEALEVRLEAEKVFWSDEFKELSLEEQNKLKDKYHTSLKTSGCGIRLIAPNKYYTRIAIHKKEVFLGYHTTYEQALHIRLEAEKLFWSKEYKSLPYSEQILIRDKFNYKDLS
jgi:group I intron endonuclease